MRRPKSDEYGAYYGSYIDQVEGDDFLAALDAAAGEDEGFLTSITEDQARFRYAEGKWSLKELLGHVTDSERVFTTRALCFARGEQQPLPGYEQDDYVTVAGFDRRPWSDLVAEFLAVRAATLALYRGLAEEDLDRKGIASDNPMTPRSIGFILVGHAKHHFGVARERYLSGWSS